jgi:phosphatidylglycerophosphate synthase
MKSVMPRLAVVEEAHRAGADTARSALALAARLLTVSRFLALPPFLWTLAALAAHPSPGYKLALIALYVAAASSDFFDGMLARAAGAANRRWGTLDVVADVIFNCASLACAAWLGRIGPWVPAGTALLAARYLWNVSCKPTDTARQSLPRDRAGNLAGVAYYLLVGLVVCDLSIGVPGARLVARCGDAVFAFTVFLLLRRSAAATRPHHGADRRSAAARLPNSSE